VRKKHPTLAIPKVDFWVFCLTYSTLNKQKLTDFYRVLHTHCTLTDTVAVTNF